MLNVYYVTRIGRSIKEPERQDRRGEEHCTGLNAGERYQNLKMADKCAGCMNKFKFFEKPRVCPECWRNFCSICLPAVKKGKKTEQTYPPPRETCVYCTRQQKTAIQSQDAEILGNFQERFYQRQQLHREPPIQTRVQLDHSRVQSERVAPAKAQPKLLSDVRELEERLQRLKDARKMNKPLHSEDDIRGRLAKLRGEDTSSDPSKPGGLEPSFQPQSGGILPTTQLGGKTQVEQAEELIEKTSEEAKLDERVAKTDGKTEEDLHNRLQALRGREGGVFHDNPITPQFQEDKKEDGTGHIITPYPVLPDVSEKEEDPANPAEVAKLIEVAAQELKVEEEQEKNDRIFVDDTAERLGRLRSGGGSGESEESDCVVHSKKRSDSQRLDFEWDHFGSPRRGDLDSSVLVARQLGIRVSGSFGGGSLEVSEDEVQALLDQMMSEATLDSRLEAGGYDSGEDPHSASAREGASAVATGYASRGEEEFPWCCICNDDATLRCYDCEGDLYCTQCFSEGHKQFGMFDHQYVPFELPKRNN